MLQKKRTYFFQKDLVHITRHANYEFKSNLPRFFAKLAVWKLSQPFVDLPTSECFMKIVPAIHNAKRKNFAARFADTDLPSL